MSERERIARIITGSSKLTTAALAKADTILSPRGEQTEAVAWRSRLVETKGDVKTLWRLHHQEPDATTASDEVVREVQPLYAHPAGAEAPSVVLREAVDHLRQCVKLVPDAGAIEAAERFLAAPPQALGETWESIAAWQRETFGPVALDRQARRAAEEMDELLADPNDVEEAADVCIVLAGYPGIREAIDRKMAKNRARQWRLNGDGTGYHVKPAPSPTAGDE